MFGSGSFAEGIGNSMITGNHGRAVIDDAVRVRYRREFIEIFSVEDQISATLMHVHSPVTRSSSKWDTFCSGMTLCLWALQRPSTHAPQSKWLAS
jgi:hypothetical protein